VQNDVAEITIDGPLSGATKGVASQIELKGKLTFDVKQGVAKTLILAIKEERGVGFAAPGVDVVAKLKIAIAPLNESKLLTGELLSNTNLPQSDEPPPLEYISEDRGYRFQYDRRWHFVSEAPERIVMRLVDRGDLIAQCNIMPASKKLDKPIPLAEFQADVQKALGQTFGQFEHASESETAAGLRMLRVVAAGTAETLPIQWRYYTLQDKTGRDITAVFTMEAPLAEQFKDQDRPLVESIEFTTPEVAEAATTKKQ
jgi:hypothetical protein